MTKKKDSEYAAFGRNEKKRIDDAYRAFLQKRGLTPVYKPKRFVINSRTATK